jgi:hypothetical protein
MSYATGIRALLTNARARSGVRVALPSIDPWTYPWTSGPFGSGDVNDIRVAELDLIRRRASTRGDAWKRHELVQTPSSQLSLGPRFMLPLPIVSLPPYVNSHRVQGHTVTARRRLSFASASTSHRHCFIRNWTTRYGRW